MVFWLDSSEASRDCEFYRRHVDAAEERDRWVQLASGLPDKDGRALPLRCDASVLTTRLSEGTSARHQLAKGRRGYLISIDGGIELNGRGLGPGDRALLRGPLDVELFCRADTPARLLLLDLPGES